MDIFLLLIHNLLPLYAFIALGWMAGKFFEVDIKSLGSLGIYIFMPIAVLGYIIQLDFKPVYIGLPFLVYGATAYLALAWFHVAKKIYPDNRAILLTMSATWGNTGYFALPVVIALFPPEVVGVYMFMLLGGIIYEATIGYYIWMRGNLSIKQSVLKIFTFPSFYAVIIGLTLNFAGYELGGQIQTYWEYAKGAYILIGMMIIGGALAKVAKLTFAPRFIGLAFLGKFIIWPAFAFLIITLDQTITHIFDHTSHQMFFMLSIVPPGANIAAFAANLNMRPEKAATTILIGTVLALITIPTMLAISGLF